MVSRKQIEEALAPERKVFKAKRKRKPMTAEQKAAAAERLAKARASKKPAKSKRWHPVCYDEKKRFKPLDQILSWQKHAKEQASIYKRDMNRFKSGKEFTKAADQHYWWQGYATDINWYLNHGDWISSFWGEHQQMKTKFKVVSPAFYPDGLRKDQAQEPIMEEKPKKRRRKKA